MKTKKTQSSEPKLSGEQIVQKKLNIMNEMLRNTDLSSLPRKSITKQG